MRNVSENVFAVGIDIRKFITVQYALPRSICISKGREDRGVFRACSVRYIYNASSFSLFKMVTFPLDSFTTPAL